MRKPVPCIAVCLFSFLTSPTFGDSPPDPPEGFRWDVIDELTDEFSGTQLDDAK